MDKKKQLTKHLDKNILRFFIVLFLLSTPVFAYRYMKNKTCKEVVFTTDADSYRQDELIKFMDNTDQAESWQWDFGDSTEVATIKNPLHVYKAPGEYNVSLMVNGFCQLTRVVNIDEKLIIRDPSKIPVFNIPETITVGESLVIKDLTPNATVWEWRFGETSSVNSKKRTAEYTYETPGLKTISLIVNHDEMHINEKQITVLPKVEINDDLNQIRGTGRRLGDGLPLRPPSHTIRTDNPPATTTTETVEEAPPKIAPNISNSNFKNKLMLVAKNQIGAGAFIDYFCGNLNTNIIVNNKEISFLVFCEKIKNKNLKIRDLEIHNDPNTNCITTVTIKHRMIIF